jgi:hypothetical protein
MACAVGTTKRAFAAVWLLAGWLLGTAVGAPEPEEVCDAGLEVAEGHVQVPDLR